jgi:hypothetical protein
MLSQITSARSGPGGGVVNAGALAYNPAADSRDGMRCGAPGRQGGDGCDGCTDAA